MSEPSGQDKQDAVEAAPFIAELAAYFDAPMDPGNAGRFDIELNLLGRAESDELTTALQDLGLMRAYGGVVLDDGNTSDHHVYLTRGPFAGAILFLCHDGEASSVVFASLAEFLDAARQAREHDAWLTDFHPSTTPLHRDQAALGSYLHALLDSDNEDDEAVVESAILSLAPVDMGLLTRLTAHRNFFYAEAVAGQIALYPTAALRPIAQLCSEHPTPQVRWAGDSAMAAIDQSG
ncbi:hypothetical protein [Massilia pseudoviolaceinigra]|uniref:hypothetical protein n=1 Tax=Massilia pseudoviolaceinigra TaxID=3057165 RepID=UPI002796B36D|nr:hypothetical protein [Massilia sp. CCM 9206]MDQ1923259.1 hypothetical protein [Massilia sp. CCM 9206]